MTILIKRTLSAGSVLLALAATVAVAQTAPAKPGGKPSAKPAGMTLGGKTAGAGKLMTRDELRTCLKGLDDNNQASKEGEARRSWLDRERAELKASGESLLVDRAELDGQLVAVREWEGRMRAHTVEIESFNRRSAAAPEAPRDAQNKLLEELKLDRERLQKAGQHVTADEVVLVGRYQSSARSYNERAAARDAKVVDWNQRNTAAVDANVNLQEARALWLSECANRAYLEDDEVAIKAGK